MKLGFCLATAALLLPVWAEVGDADRFYKAIRNDEVATLKTLAKDPGTDVRDKRGTTPLMLAAAFGSIEAMKVLLDAGADVNAKNSFDATALMWCATDLAKVRLLVGKGADVNAKSKQGRTALLIAASSDGASEIVRFLLDKGADIKAAMANPANTPLIAAINANDTATVKLLLDRGESTDGPAGAMGLMGAAANGNIAVMKMLLDRHADPNSISPPAVSGEVKNGKIQLGLFTPLLLAASYGGPEAVGLLLEKKANPNAQDVRGMTPLMLAIASDRPDPKVIRMLLDHGADPKIKSKNGENSIDWARKFNNPSILSALDLKPETRDVKLRTEPVTAKVALERSTALLQRSTSSFFVEGGCASCHAHNLTTAALDAVKPIGVPINGKAAMEHSQQSKFFWSGQEQTLLQRVDPPGGSDMIEFGALQFGFEHFEPCFTTDAMAHNIAAQQQVDGSWHGSGVARPPMEDGDFTRTALGIYTLTTYGGKGRRGEYEQRIAKAAAWLKAAIPLSTEDRNMQLMGLKWAGAPPSELHGLASRIEGRQNADGGWSQTPYLASDAYATGQSLYALRMVGFNGKSDAFKKGSAFLLKTQAEDGSWHVASRSPKFQPYFQGGFPHDHDQWISMSGTSWATIALSYSLME